MPSSPLTYRDRQKPLLRLVTTKIRLLRSLCAKPQRCEAGPCATVQLPVPRAWVALSAASVRKWLRGHKPPVRTVLFVCC